MTVRVIGARECPPNKVPAHVINVTSRSKSWSQALSPFFLGPVECYDGLVAQNVENAWQYSKVYHHHMRGNDVKWADWLAWRNGGFAKRIADRYPAGKGAVPLFSYWAGERLRYIEARKKIYIPLYAKAARASYAWPQLVKAYEIHRANEEGWARFAQNARSTEPPGVLEDITQPFLLWDFDAYDHRALGLSWDQVINNSTMKMGHGFVLAMMLEKAGPFAENT